MCGIAGFFWTGSEDHESLAQEMGTALRQMGATLQRRGPDSFGVWSNDLVGISLVHRRLAILDLSADGHQPMHSRTGRYVISFNGEIYNYKILKTELAERGSTFIGNSDTEVLLACIENWGIVETLGRIVGMFAFAVWDCHEQKFYLARDRLGEKPLYYGWLAGGLSFASEISALKVRFSSQPAVNQEALASYLQFGRVPSPLSIYEGIYKLPPGAWICFTRAEANAQPIDFSPAPESGRLKPTRYWDPREKALAAFQQPRIEQLDQAVAGVEELLKKAVAEQMVADVPLGAFLSGGIDSSLIVALMQEQCSKALETFTIGFSENSFNEAHYARKISDHLKTSHNELYISPRDVLDVIPKIPNICDEPLADQSIVPTYLLCALARKKVTVSISGDGADEVFGGYERHIFGPRFEKINTSLPLLLRRVLARALTSVSPQVSARIFEIFSNNSQSVAGIKNISSKLAKVARLLSAETGEDIYRASSTHWPEPNHILLQSQTRAHFTNLSGDTSAIRNTAEKLMLLDLTHYLPDDILMKLDRAAMAVSLESRAPYLNHKLIEYSFSISPKLKCDGNQGKLILRELLAQKIPRHLWERPKAGFSIPLAQWLRKELRPWAEQLLEGEQFSHSNYFNVAVIRKLWRQHRDGKTDAHNQLWNILMFEAWRQAQ